MNRLKQKGFTLIEIMIVVVIMGVLAAMVVPKILSRPDQAKKVVARSDISTISQALELYKLDNGFYPSMDQGLEALVKKTNISPEPTNWNPDGYLKKLPMDPWGNPYMYRIPGEHGKYDLYSFGADGQESGEDTNAMITSWEKDQ